MPTTQTRKQGKTEQAGISARIEGLEVEIKCLERRVVEAQAASREAHDRINQIARRRDELAVDAFSGEADAIAELARLADEAGKEQWNSEVAEAAAVGFRSELSRKKAELAEAREQEHAETSRVMGEELSALRREMSEQYVAPLKGRLAEMTKQMRYLENHQRKSASWVQPTTYSTPEQRAQSWLRQQLREWIS